VPGRSIAGRPYPDDDGSADPRVSAALAAYAAGRGSEHTALAALAACRLLVPVVALLTEDEAGDAGLRREKTSEMALPTLIGHDGRRALLAFTCLDSLARWRPDARPLPVTAAQVWRAGTAEAGAVVIDVAGPVPLAVAGARLEALASSGAVPPPHQDPDVLTLARELVAREQVLTGFRLLPGEPGTDMTLQVRLASGLAAADPLSQAAIGRVAAGIMAGAGHSLRRGVTVAAIGAARPDRQGRGRAI
jgi:SseB protein N-terminal domain